MVVTSPNTTAAAPNPFSGPQSSSASTSNSTSGTFEQQLSTAITDSLKKLGVAPGELNISIRNSGGSAATQILISYNPAVVSPETSGETPAATPAGNPFNMSPGKATSTPQPAATTLATDWSMWDGPRDKRDAIPTGGGALTATGSPLIALNEAPAVNQYNYSGLAARNPYFTTPSNPLREGYVLGFENWFTQPFILGGKNGPVAANKMFYSTQEGAEEALRLVQQYEPDATLHLDTWSGGPFSSSIPKYSVSLPGGRLVSAGGILANYYNGGSGVTTESDRMLESTLRMA